MILGLIPARFASTRFPGKPLVRIQGKSMIQRVYEQARASSLLETVVVATDDQRIFDHVQAFGGRVLLTRADHVSGTDRCAEIAEQMPEAEIILNIQGDEPFIQPEQIDLLAETLLDNPGFDIATLAKRIEQPEQLFNPNLVKVALGDRRQALYFSRQPIPFVRGQEPSEWLQHAVFYKHIGLYAFRRPTLLAISKLQPGQLELAESLEQLRWLAAGYPIVAGITHLETRGIDTPDDLAALDLILQ